jgi:hypothetical protein
MGCVNVKINFKKFFLKEFTYNVESLDQQLFQKFTQETRAPQKTCHKVARRIVDEVNRICQESERIQNSGEIETWQENLAQHRLKQCLKYYKLGSKKGRIELQSTLSAIIYRYINTGNQGTTYHQRISLIEDFLQNFYGESLNVLRREYNLESTYTPKLLLELAEYMAFTERYGKRRIQLPRNRSQQLIILRAQTFSQQQPSETSIDLDTAADGGFFDDNSPDLHNPLIQQFRAFISSQNPENPLLEGNLRDTVISELIEYLESRNQKDCIDYFILRLKDLSTSDIEQILGLNSRKRDYLQQRFKYHLYKFALSHRWELVHQWLEADLEKNLGLTPKQWEIFTHKLTKIQLQILNLKQKQIDHQEIIKNISLTKTQLEKQWLKILELAWDIRNQ